MSDIIGQLADHMSDVDPPVNLRIAVVTAVEATGSRRLKTNQTDTAWLNRDKDSDFAVGDRVWLLKQGSVFLVAGRLSGESAGVPVGTMMVYAGATVPAGWLKADGAALSRTTYAALFAALGTVYGAGDGSTTFNLPDMDDRVVVGSGFSYTRGQQGGAATVTLSAAQMPSHTHSAGVGTAAVTVASGTGASVSNATAATTGSTGSGSAHENMPPFVAMPMIIRVL